MKFMHPMLGGNGGYNPNPMPLSGLTGASPNPVARPLMPNRSGSFNTGDKGASFKTRLMQKAPSMLMKFGNMMQNRPTGEMQTQMPQNGTMFQRAFNRAMPPGY